MSRAVDDITQASAMGIDAFALNVQAPDASWCQSALTHLFNAASSTNFKLFLSLDMAVRGNPSDFFPMLQQYLNHPSYYRHNSRPLLSTFHGAANMARPNSVWQDFLTQIRSSTSTNPLFLPNFEDWSGFGGAYTPQFFSAYPSVDGVLAWETAWPFPSAPDSMTTNDEANLAAAHAAQKLYVLPVSPYQFKHLSPDQNWFRPGGMSLIHGLRRALSLRPDFVELVTWNDAGEGHWIGNIWREGITQGMADLIAGFEHGAWRGVVAMFVAAIRNGVSDEGGVVPLGGRTVQGAFWYRPLKKDSHCWNWLGKPRGWEGAEDAVNVAVALRGDVRPGSVQIKVWSGGALVATLTGRSGMNVYQVAYREGQQKVQVVTFPGGQVLAEGTGPMEVTWDIGRLGGQCNFNYQVVDLSS